MKLAIVGTRTFNDFNLLESKIKENYNINKISEIISGGAKGADALAEKLANKYNIKLNVHYPNWEKYGKSAGPIRNKLIINECDECIAFWDGISKGTKSSINLCNEMEKNFKIIKI